MKALSCTRAARGHARGLKLPGPTWQDSLSAQQTKRGAARLTQLCLDLIFGHFYQCLKGFEVATPRFNPVAAPAGAAGGRGLRAGVREGASVLRLAAAGVEGGDGGRQRGVASLVLERGVRERRAALL